MTPVVHFVRFPDAHGMRFWAAVRVFGMPAFMHQLWDLRARREILEGDTVVFAKGDHDQPMASCNGNDEAYEYREWRKMEAKNLNDE